MVPVSCVMSTCLHILEWLWYLGFLWKFIKEVKVCLKLGQSVRHFTWRPKYVLSLLVKLNCYKRTLFEWNGLRLLRHPSFCCLSAFMSAAAMGHISMKYDTGLFYETVSRKSKYVQNWWKISFTLCGDLSTFYCQGQ